MRFAYQSLQRDHIHMRMVLVIICNMRDTSRPNAAVNHSISIVFELQPQTFRSQIPRTRASQRIAQSTISETFRC